MPLRNAPTPFKKSACLFAKRDSPTYGSNYFFFTKYKFISFSTKDLIHFKTLVSFYTP